MKQRSHRPAGVRYCAAVTDRSQQIDQNMQLDWNHRYKIIPMIIITLQLTSWYLYSFNLFKTPKKIPLKVSTCYVLDLLKTRRCFVTPTRSVFLLFWITKTRNSLFKVPSKTPTGTLNIYIHIFSLWDKLYSQQNWPITVMKLKNVTIYAWFFFNYSRIWIFCNLFKQKCNIHASIKSFSMLYQTLFQVKTMRGSSHML